VEGANTEASSEAGQGTEVDTDNKKGRAIQLMLLKFIITGFLPFSIVENKSFKEFCHMLNKTFKVPCSKTVSGKSFKFLMLLIFFANEALKILHLGPILDELYSKCV
jgi:hypothetical protein